MKKNNLIKDIIVWANRNERKRERETKKKQQQKIREKETKTKKRRKRKVFIKQFYISSFLRINSLRRRYIRRIDSLGSVPDDKGEEEVL